MTVSNAAGSTNVGTWNIRVLLQGMVAAWGDDAYGQCDRPVTLTNAMALAAGAYHSVAMRDDGTIAQWGGYWDGTNFYAVGSPPDYSNLISVAASAGHDIALQSDGTVVTWGLTNDVANYVPTNLVGVKAVAAGWNHNVALLTNGTVRAWGANLFGELNVPTGLSNVTAISANSLHTLALRSDGTVVAWGYGSNGETNVPTGLSNVVAIAAGGMHNLALKSDGTVVAWGNNSSNQCDVPVGLSNVLAIAAGWEHSVALKNDGTVVSWGDNTYGETNVPGTLTKIKLIAAGGDHTLAAMFSPLVQYPVDVEKDLLLIYNTNSADSAFVKDYYLAHRPMVSGANVLGIGYTNAASPGYYEMIDPVVFTNNILSVVQSWLSASPTKRPQYVILFPDVPSIVFTNTLPGVYPWTLVTTNYQPARWPSVQCQLNSGTASGWSPFVTSINMNGYGGTNDCIAYINKLASIGINYSLEKPILSASADGYENTNYYFDDSRPGFGTPNQNNYCYLAAMDVLNINPAPSVTYSNTPYDSGIPGHITNGVNVTGYMSWGVHGYYNDTNADYALNGTLEFSGQSSWWIIETIESFNGERLAYGQGYFPEVVF